ncbi:uncharacterized protein LOC144637300 isoform X1 [Oculina patagonica]
MYHESLVAQLKMALALRVILVLLSLFISPLNGQIPKKEKYYAIKEDIPHIRCETCQKAVKYLYGKTHEMRGDGTTKRLEEDKVIDLVEKSCSPDNEEGSWISKIDLIERNGELRLSGQSDTGKCKRECQTVSKACEESIAEVDTDLAELLWKDKLTLSKLINEVCYSLSSACTSKRPKLKAGERKIDEKFHVMTEEGSLECHAWKCILKRTLKRCVISLVLIKRKKKKKRSWNNGPSLSIGPGIRSCILLTFTTNKTLNLHKKLTPTFLLVC